MAKKQKIIPIGGYYISHNPDEELVTVVGSCVCTTLYDSIKKIAGLVHIVLPGRREYRRRNDENTFYADTGITYLIEQMIKNGAKKEHITATITGGASQTQTDNPDSIGRQNVLMCKKQLSSENITIFKETTGGTKGYKIIMDVETGNTRIRQSPPNANNRIQLPGKIDLQILKSIQAKIEHLHPNNIISEKLLKAVHNPKTSNDELINIISHDSIMTLQILRMANSSYYGIPGQIDSIFSIERLLGKRQFKLICVVASTMKNRKNLISNDYLVMKNFSNHQFATALVSKYLTKKFAPDIMHKAYTASLLHSFGRLALSVMFNQKISAEEIFSNYTVRESQDKLVDFLFNKWNFPRSLTRITQIVENCDTESQKKDLLTDFVHISCKITHLIGISYIKTINLEEQFNDILEEISITEQLESMMPDIINLLKQEKLLEEANQSIFLNTGNNDE